MASIANIGGRDVRGIFATRRDAMTLRAISDKPAMVRHRPRGKPTDSIVTDTTFVSRGRMGETFTPR